MAPTPSPPSDEAAQEPSRPPAPPTVEESHSVPSRGRVLFGEGPTLCRALPPEVGRLVVGLAPR